jgi:3-isopropylmalate/(R)-2-methylmalate dehydratase small subunit
VSHARAGRVWCFGDHVNTDLIQPLHAMLRPMAEQTRHVFEANRPGWNELVQQGDVIVAGANFGTGSSRPAAQLLGVLGIGGLLAESINGLFLRNCVNHGFAALECPGVSAAFEEGDAAAFDIATGEVRNVTRGVTLQGRPWTPDLLAILDAGGLLEQLHAEGLLLSDTTRTAT